MAAVPFVEELLVMVSVPVAAPAEVGSNWTVNVTVWFGLSVSGKVAPETEKPAPVRLAELTVTGAPPVEVKATDWVAGELRLTSPNATLVALMLSVDVAALSCRAKISDVVPALADSVTA